MKIYAEVVGTSSGSGFAALAGLDSAVGGFSTGLRSIGGFGGLE